MTAEPTIKPIETTYRGFRFRSRLEARWAVFFDAMKWAWRYEPQGFELDGERYLPDFFVDPIGWVEVKGSLDGEGLRRLANFVRALPIEPDSLELVSARPLPVYPRLLLVGDIPEPTGCWAHQQFGFVKRRALDEVTPLDVAWRWARFGVKVPFPVLDWHFVAGGWPSQAAWHAGQSIPWIDPNSVVTEAYRAARSARFEHGESGS